MACSKNSLGGSSTAEDALRNADLTGKVAVVTGGGSGIGLETVRVLATVGGATVFSGVRNVEAAKAEVAKFATEGSKGKIVVEHLDLTDLSSIRAFAERVKAATGRLDYLILNAGVMMTPLSRTSAGWEMQFGTNHMGHFYLTKLLLPLCEAGPAPARVVAVSSMGHRYGGLDLEDLNWEKRSYSSMGAYGASKSANIVFAHELTRRCKAAGSPVEAFSLHPGVIDTNLGKHLGSVSQALLRWAIKLRALPSAKSIPQGAATTVYAALAPELAGRGGAYLDSCREKLPVGRLMQEDLGQELWARSEAMLEEALRK